MYLVINYTIKSWTDDFLLFIKYVQYFKCMQYFVLNNF